jgi:hypothetical protein
MSFAVPDIARLQHTTKSLNVILKNTHFKDDILTNGSKIKLRIDFSTKLPVLVFRFDEPYFDFVQVIVPQTVHEWLYKYPIVIKLVLADSVITDQLSSSSFIIHLEEGDRLREATTAVKLLTPIEIQEVENYVSLNVNKLLI